MPHRVKRRRGNPIERSRPDRNRFGPRATSYDGRRVHTEISGAGRNS
jgi:hypothetical protein